MGLARALEGLRPTFPLGMLRAALNMAETRVFAPIV